MSAARPSSFPSNSDDPRLDLSSPLKPGDAVAALLLAPDGYLLQLRDAKRGIFFPGVWGCFGGGVDEDETPEQALVRELEEELGLSVEPSACAFFANFEFTVDVGDVGPFWRVFYEIHISASALDTLKLGEGAAMRVVPPAEILTNAIDLTPYDAFALWLHINRGRLRSD